MFMKIFSYPYDKANELVSSLTSKIGGNSFARKNNVFLILELIVITVITIVNQSFLDTFTGAYESTTVGGITSLFFSFIDNKVGDNFGLIALIGSGIVLILYEKYTELLSKCNYVGFVEWFETTLFYFTASLIVFEIIDLFQKLIYLVDNFFFTLFFVPIIIICAAIGIKALVDNIVILCKSIFYGIIAEWVILLFVFVIGTPLLIHVEILLSSFLGPEKLYKIHIALNDFKNSFTDLQSSLRYQRIVVSIVFFIGYTIVNHRERAKAAKKEALATDKLPLETPSEIHSKIPSEVSGGIPVEEKKLGYFEGVLKNLGELDDSQSNNVLAILKCFFKKPS